MFGRLQLLRLLGKSERTMAWRVLEPRQGQELMIVLPRVQPADAAALQRWQQQMRQVARLAHPQIAPVVELGVQDGWPYAAYELQELAPLSERLGPKGMPGPEAAACIAQALQALAYAHEAGLAHHDPQLHLLLVHDKGSLRLAGLGVGSEMAALQLAMAAAQTPGAAMLQRDAAQRDVLCAGLLLHHLLAGAPALEEPDTAQQVLRLPPQGREIVRLPWSLAQPVAEPLRAIVNRATDRQERQRYHGARTMLRALEGWLQASDGSEAGPLALLADKLRTAGVLPSAPGAAERVARLAMMEGQRTNELAELVLQDLALSFEMLRMVNSAQVRGAQVSGSGPVLTVRRAIAMLGLEGVRRAALALRPWPGPLEPEGAAALQQLLQRCKRAGRVAMALRPAGYDAEVVYLITLLQSIGRLVVRYHFPEESQQIRRLMQPAPAAREGEPEEPGMSEEAAAYAVLGADIEAIGAAVVRLWGMGEGVQAMLRRHGLTGAVHTPETDDDFLRAAASCANEALDALELPPTKVAQGLQRVVQRYGRALQFSLRELQEALADRPAESAAPISVSNTQPGVLGPAEDAPAAQRGSRLRAAAQAAR